MPFPPQLVAVLQEHIDTFGTAQDGRLFASEGGGVVSSSTYYRAWQEARLLALPPAAVASPLARRPYDLRHSALSTWLNAGVDPTEVAARAGQQRGGSARPVRQVPRRPAGGRQPADRGAAPRVRVRGEPLRPEAPGETRGPSCSLADLGSCGELQAANRPQGLSWGCMAWHMAGHTRRPRSQRYR